MMLTTIITMKIQAFTLAEVLITLSVIGIVAAMTLPNITGYYKKKVVETELKKAFSVISQTIKLSEAFNESAIYWQYPSEGSGSSSTGTEETVQFSEKYIKPYLKYTSAEKRARNVLYSDGTSSYLTKYIDKNLGFVMPDGIFLQFTPLAEGNHDRGYVMMVYVGTTNKGKTKEFVEGKNFFSFTLNNTLGDASKISLEPQWYLNWSCQKLKENPENFIENCRKNTRETSGVSSSVYCTYMIYCNGWEVPDNYPIKL